MNSSPFSLETTFHPEDAREDKIDLEIRGWEVHGLSPDFETVHGFKRRMSGPPKGSEDLAWPANGLPAQYGWFFTCPGMKGKDRSKLGIRQQALPHPENNRRHEAPLCGGHCLFYKDKNPHPVTGKAVHKAKLTLALNMQRFARHQARKDVPVYPFKYRLQASAEDRSAHDEEFAFDGEDNWLPSAPKWQQFEKHVRVTDCLNLIAKRVDEDLQRACDYENDGETNAVSMERIGKPYAVSRVETLWEFPSENPIGDTLQIGAKLMHLKRVGAATKIKRLVFKEANRVLNSPCFIVPLAEGMSLKLYAKTNQRIRFEVVQTGLRRNLSKILKEAESLVNPWDVDYTKNPFLPSVELYTWEDAPELLKLLRLRASSHMNQLMKELKKGRNPHVKACSVVELLAKVAAAVPAGFGSEAKRLSQIQTLLFFLCYQRGFRGSLKQGPFAKALECLRKAGVLEFERSRQFYTLTEAYVATADTLATATGDPVLSVFGMNWGAYRVLKGGKMPVRLRE